MGLQELVDMGPHFGDPVYGAIQIIVPDACADLSFHQLPAQVASQEALDRLHVVGAQHPAEVVMQLQVGCGACRLVHRANDVGTVQQQCHQHQVISTTVCDATMWFGQKRAPYVFISRTNTHITMKTQSYGMRHRFIVQQQHHQHQVISTTVCDITVWFVRNTEPYISIRGIKHMYHNECAVL